MPAGNGTQRIGPEYFALQLANNGYLKTYSLEAVEIVFYMKVASHFPHMRHSFNSRHTGLLQNLIRPAWNPLVYTMYFFGRSLP